MVEIGGVSLQYRDLMKSIEMNDSNGADILIVEDEDAIARLMGLHLRAAGFTTHRCADGDEALNCLCDGEWRLVILDRMLPGTGGMQVLRWLKGSEKRAHIPVLMVTALGMASERVQGLNEGADDYLPKPFEPDELVARARALLRRTRIVNSGGTATPTLQLDPDVPVVYEGDKRVDLRPMEYKLLQILMRKPGKTRARDYLLDHVWGNDVYVEARTVDVTVKRLRKALKELDRSECIETVRGMGYRFLPPSE
ncbi:response regulator [Mariprofundus erugo]|uniref:Response regulator n=2 Tax=Mariprofundus erugo TaxID=2528639 RepID=A0A5R9GF81_9PROT|nr:response regulator [Mariprofundus erugo]TLS78037.1 response regulator [Mariprofundus erugo]